MVIKRRSLINILDFSFLYIYQGGQFDWFEFKAPFFLPDSMKECLCVVLLKGRGLRQ